MGLAFFIEVPYCFLALQQEGTTCEDLVLGQAWCFELKLHSCQNCVILSHLCIFLMAS